MIWGVVGSIVGVIGGLVGTYIPIANSQSQRERNFLIQCSIVVWVFIAGFLTLLLTLPSPYSHLLWIPLGASMTYGMRYINETQSRIRMEESASQ